MNAAAVLRRGAILSACLASTLSAQSTFVRGDFNDDGEIDIADPVSTLLHLFGGMPAACLDRGDANDDGALDLSDAVYTLGYLFLGAPAPALPFPACGGDPTLDGLDCLESRSCPPVANEIVAIRRVNSGIEIELRSDMPFPVRALHAALCIGEESFVLARHPNSGDLHTIIFLLTEEELGRLHQNDLVTIQYGGCSRDISFLRPYWDLWIFGLLDLGLLEG